MRWPDLLRRRSPRGSGPHGTGGLTGGGPLPRPARFGRQREARGGWLRSAWAWLAVLCILGLAALWLGRSVLPLGDGRQEVPALRWQACAEAASRERCVVDGDSIRIGGETVRLAGLDAPELAGRCEAERVAAHAARGALLAWLNAGAFTLTEPESGRDKYGRPLRTLTRGRSDAAAVLVAQGLAQSYSGGARVDWCAPRAPA